MISNAKGLWGRSVELAKENVPEPFVTYPFAEELGLGWYPSRLAFQESSGEAFYKALPDVSGAVFPYYHDHGQLSHLAIAPYREDGRLDRKKRVTLPARGHGRCAGIFGLARVRHTRHAHLLVTDDETIVCREPDAIAVSRLTPRLAQVIARGAVVVSLKSDNSPWLHTLFGLARYGVQVTVGNTPLVEYLVAQIMELFEQDIGLAIITHRVTELLDHLVPLEKAAVIQLLQQRANLDLRAILPNDFHIYRREEDFYQVVRARLEQLVAGAQLHLGGLRLMSQDGRRFDVPLDPAAVGAVICELTHAKLDLVDWAYHDLKELPSFYLFGAKDQLETRAVVARKICDVVLAVLTRLAARAPGRTEQAVVREASEDRAQPSRGATR